MTAKPLDFDKPVHYAWISNLFAFCRQRNGAMISANKHKHLDLVSATIDRMAQNSFTVRGWCITVVSGVIAFGVQSQSTMMTLSAIIPVALFWILDAYYVRQERGFRNLFDHVRLLREEEIDYSMSPEYSEKLLRVMFDSSVFLFLYGGGAVVISATSWTVATTNLLP